ncbi:MAG: S46 family peptidase [Bryobacteraceae bacterium]
MSRSTVLRFALAGLIGCLEVSGLLADEGMWTFDNPPLAQLKEKYGFTPSAEWLDHIRLSSVRLNDGGSGSFVSPNGLLLTNHHVARSQLEKSSTQEHDYIKDGFYAPTLESEMKAPDLEVNVLVSLENVSARVQEALKNLSNTQDELAARRAVIANIERESTEKTGLRSDVVTLYAGGEYWLYRYKKYTDIRIVFAPEQQIAFFGGDPDNFTYPRYDVDMAFFRVYENGKPINSTNYLKWNAQGAADQELVFVSGHPGRTQRLQTMAELIAWRDDMLPNILAMLGHRRQVLLDYSAKGPEQARQAASTIFFLENSIKALGGGYEQLQKPSLIAKKKQEEDDFKAKVLANAEWKQQYGAAWEAIASAEEKAATRKNLMFRQLDSRLYNLALSIVQYVAEVKKEDGKRLPGFHESQLESLKIRLFSRAPVYPGLEEATLAGSLSLGLEKLGKDDPFISTALNGRSPDEVAKQLIAGTKLADPALRKQLVEGGEAAVAQSTDPLIVFARQLDPIVREHRKWTEDNVTSVVERAGEQLGKARFLVYGKASYPDATFTLRLSYGKVAGYPMNGTKAPYKTTIFGMYDRAASFDNVGPFELPSRYKEGRSKLTLSTPLNFVTDNDIIGGNSGSPVINRNGEIVGLIFDGNIESLAGDYIYDGSVNRSVAVHTAGMTEVLKKLYPVEPLLKELTGQ